MGVYSEYLEKRFSFEQLCDERKKLEKSEILLTLNNAVLSFNQRKLSSFLGSIGRMAFLDLLYLGRGDFLFISLRTL